MSTPDQPPSVRPHLARLPGYAPVVPLAERARQAGLAPEDCLKLDANENPYGMHPRVRDALAAALADPHFGAIYPDPDQTQLRQAIASYTGLDPARIIAGAGADELLELALRALLEPGGAIVTAPPSFGMYPFLANLLQLRIIESPRGQNFALSEETLLADAANAPADAVVLLTSPNNPSGDIVPASALQQLLEAGRTVILDEAYIEFAGFDRSAQPLLDRYPRLVIIRTFSKWAGIAGLRLGYALAHPDLVRNLFKVRQPYSVNQAAEIAAIAAIAAADDIAQQIQAIRSTRDQLHDALQSIDGLDPIPSEANFILNAVDPTLGDARDLHDRLAATGIFTRIYSDPTLANHIRISVPREDQLNTLVERLKAAC